MSAPTLPIARPSSAPISAPIPLVPSTPGYETAPAIDRAQLPGVASREALLRRLDEVSALAADAPLSFLIVAVRGLRDVAVPEAGPRAMLAIAHALSAQLSPLDLAGRYGGTAFGVVLQGRGARSAGILAARLQHQLNRLPGVVHPLHIDVYAATGTGACAAVLPVAAAESLVDAG